VFGLAILLRSVWTRHAKGNTMGEKEYAGRKIVKFTATIALYALDDGAKLCVNIGKKLERVKNVSDFWVTGKFQI
jgi:hypothetical protein